ncbi:proline--tRNA ligase [Tribonema minus]|uniref:proline--tRNA ligase n=1 Tax=Tribonema minus TaxID=303371 RepID=A0A835YT63_9STRA|nr:proline--tRNA ligase [Tribonema minus]
MTASALSVAGSPLQVKLVLAAARYADVTVEVQEAAADAEGNNGTSTAVLTTPQGPIRGLNAVLRYVSRLRPASELEGSNFQSSQVDQWVEFASNEMCHMAGGSASAIAQQDKVLAALEAHLASRTFVVGQRMSVADMCIAAALEGVPLAADKQPAVCRFYGTIVNQPLFNGTAKKASSRSSKAGKAKQLEQVQESENKAIDKLTELGLPSVTYAHAPAMTVEEQMQEIGSLPGAKTKNLFLRDKKHGIYLVTAAHDSPTDTKTIAALLSLPPSANLRFADEETLSAILGVKQGSVGPLAVLNDTEGQATFVLDKKLAQADIINSHPLRNDRTTAVSAKDLIAYANACNHPPTILDFASAASANAGKSNGKPAGGAASRGAPAAKGGKPAKSTMDKQKHDRAADSKKELKKETLLGIDKSKTGDFAGWYQQVITYSEMIDYYDISGCYILRPWAFEIWEHIQHWFDAEIKKLGVSNSYFPLFVSKKALEAEKDHVEGFAPEVAWVTKSGETDLAEPIAVRPTSETIMYPAFARWIRSHRDLPLCLNQWSNVVRWEFKDPTPFLRSREFLWQEGHTAHTTFEEAEEMVFQILDLYRRVYEELLAVPVIKGTKTELEKFAGGFRTTTVEAYITGSGRAIQGATSHNLGQNFGKMFNINFEAKDGTSKIPWQTSWGITTRSIGVCVMCHGDDQGLVLPPRVAPLQVVIVPVVTKKFGLDQLSPFVDKIVADLRGGNVRVKFDTRDNYTAGWKYNHWEQKGVPIRLEVGPRDVEAERVVVVRRDTGDKQEMPVEAGIQGRILGVLEDIQNNLFAKATASRDEHYSRVLEWADFVPALNKNDIVLTPFCNEGEWEEKVKAMSRDEALQGGSEDVRTSTSVAAKTLCIPLDQPELPEGTKCFVSGKPATCWVLWGRSY